MVNTLDIFKIILVIQMFYAGSMTLITYSLPEDTLNYIDIYTNVGDELSLDSISSEVQDSLQQQQNIPIIELGSLLFYSGNILIDLMLNFIFAIPEMFSLIINGLLTIFSIDPVLSNTILLMTSVIITVMYTIGIIQILTAVRSGRLV